MFRRTKKKNPDLMETYIGEGTEITGQLRSAAGIRIDGQLEGDIQSEGDVIIGTSGSIRSNVQARNITIAGTVYGDVHAHHQITLQASGQLYGNTTCQTFAVAEGSIFMGSSKMGRTTSIANESETQLSSVSR